MARSGNDDWFRKEAWSARDEGDFRARLSRARPEKRPQYLRIQAEHLVEAGLPEPALRLLDEFLELAPDDAFASVAHEARARALVDLGRPDEAVAAYRAALAAQRAHPQVKGYAALGLAELVVYTNRRSLFDEAVAVLDTLHEESPFPAVRYREAAVRALIADASGDRTAARRHAQEALSSAATLNAPFARHPGVGLVRQLDPLVHERLEAMCAA